MSLSDSKPYKDFLSDLGWQTVCKDGREQLSRPLFLCTRVAVTFSIKRQSTFLVPQIWGARDWPGPTQNPVEVMLGSC